MNSSESRGKDSKPSSAATSILGVEVSATNPSDAVATIDGWVTEGRSAYVCVTGVHGVMEAQRDPELKSIHNQAGLVVPDGMPMVWASHYAGHDTVARVYGPDLMVDLCSHGAKRNWRMYYAGGAEGVAAELANVMENRFPGLATAGTFCPPFRPLTVEERRALVDDITRTKPDIVWVGLSTPKQERLMADLVRDLNGPTLIGVGAAFDFHTGRVRQAPVWMQRRGLEWAFRLKAEPRRLARRYLSIIPRFLVSVAKDRPRAVVKTSTFPQSQ